jgi:hypothetical protein
MKDEKAYSSVDSNTASGFWLAGKGSRPKEIVED